MVYEHTAHRIRENNLDHILFRSIVGSFIIKSLFDIIIGAYLAESTAFYSIMLLALSFVLAYLIALFMKSKCYERVQHLLKINRTQNHCIWHDIFAKQAWVRVFMPDDHLTYLGQIELLEENQREPILLLGKYQVIGMDGDVIVDYSEKPTEKIILNLKNFEKIELIEMDKAKPHKKLSTP